MSNNKNKQVHSYNKQLQTYRHTHSHTHPCPSAKFSVSEGGTKLINFYNFDIYLIAICNGVCQTTKTKTITSSDIKLKK